MEYFKMFDIPVQLKVDHGRLTRQYHILSRKYHPDFHANADTEMQVEALEKSAVLNKAYKTFQDMDHTIRYVLMEKGLMEEEEKYPLPPDFLMEMLDLNEAVESKDPGAENRISEIENEIYEPVKEIVENYQEGVTSKEALLQVKEYYYKKKYLLRLREMMQD